MKIQPKHLKHTHSTYRSSVDKERRVHSQRVETTKRNKLPADDIENKNENYVKIRYIVMVLQMNQRRTTRPQRRHPITKSQQNIDHLLRLLLTEETFPWET